MQSLAAVVVMGSLLAILLVLLHTLAWQGMARFNLEAALAKRPDLVIFVTLVGGLVILSSAFGLAVIALFRNRDQELIMASPVPIRDVYLLRGLAVAVTAIALPALAVLPFANMGAAHGHWQMLAAYPVGLAIGAFFAALALAGTLALARWLGPRRGYRAAQVVGAAVAMTFLIGMQFQSLLPASTQAGIRAWTASEQGRAWLGPHSVLTWPARALFGDPLPALAIVVLGAAIFALVVRTTTAGFVSAAQEDPGISQRRGASRGPARPFRAGLAAIVISKELKLIARDPTFLAKALFQMLAMLPLMLILVRQSELAALLGASLVLLASMLEGTLAWIAVSGEEAPDLLDSAPVAAERLRWLKVAAVLLPVAVLCLPFLAWYAVLSWRLFAVVAVFLALALSACGVIQVWLGAPGSGRDLRVRMQKNRLANIVETLSTFGFAGGCYLAMAGWYRPALVVACLGLLGPVVAWLAGRRRATP
jgi:ABC-2 type transport system permease protein